MNRPATSNCRRQQGALTVITPLLLLIVVILSVMALDGARLYMLRGEMQAQVNVAAQAAASGTQSCGGLAPTTATVRQRALAAARAQGYTGVDEALLVETGLIDDADDDGVLVFEPVNFIEESNAVLVSYTRNEPISLLLPETMFGTLDITVNAAARKEAVASISAAGGLASVGGDATLLGTLLGAVLGQPGYALDPTSLGSLQDATVRLGDLLTALGVNRVADLLPLDAEQLASTVGSVAGVTGPVADLLDDIAAAPGIETIQIRDVIDVVENASVPANSEFPLYDLVISLVLNVAREVQADTDGVIALPVNISGLSIPLVANIEAVDLALHVGEAPSIAIGPARQDKDGNWRTRFYAPDITLQLMARAELLPVPLGIVDFSLADLNVPLAVNAGGGGGALVAAHCASGTANTVEFTVEVEREVARIVTGSLDSSGVLSAAPLEANVGRLILLGIPVLDGILYLNAEVDGSVPGISETITLDPRYNLYCDPVEGCDEIAYNDQGGGVSGLDLDIMINEATLLKSGAGQGINLGSLLNPIVDLIEGLLDSVVESLGEALINPLLRTLGIGLGSISVNVSAANQDAIQVIENITVAAET